LSTVRVSSVPLATLPFIPTPTEHANGISLSPALDSSLRRWRFVSGFQLAPTTIMTMGLFSAHESPCWLAPVCRVADAQVALTYLHRATADAPAASAGLVEIEAALAEERAVSEGGIGTQEVYILWQFKHRASPVALASFIVQHVVAYVHLNRIP
jgi:hypothetical protein